MTPNPYSKSFRRNTITSAEKPSLPSQPQVIIKEERIVVTERPQQQEKKGGGDIIAEIIGGIFPSDFSFGSVKAAWAAGAAYDNRI